MKRKREGLQLTPWVRFVPYLDVMIGESLEQR